MPIFTFPDEPEWNEAMRAVEFTVEVGEYKGRVSIPRKVFQRLLDSPSPERCVAAFHAERTRFEQAVERKIERRALTDDGNLELSVVDITGRESSNVPAGDRAIYHKDRGAL